MKKRRKVESITWVVVGFVLLISLFVGFKFTAHDIADSYSSITLQIGNYFNLSCGNYFLQLDNILVSSSNPIIKLKYVDGDYITRPIYNNSGSLNIGGQTYSFIIINNSALRISSLSSQCAISLSSLSSVSLHVNDFFNLSCGGYLLKLEEVDNSTTNPIIKFRH